jgi:hypothetical protein
MCCESNKKGGGIIVTSWEPEPGAGPVDQEPGK